MDLNKLRKILQLVAESDVAEVEIDEDGAKVTIRKDAPTVMIQPTGYYPALPYYSPPGGQVPAAPPLQTPPPAVHGASHAPAAYEPPLPTAEHGLQPGANETVLTAPIVGTFYTAPSPDADPYVAVGSSVTEGTVLCIIEAMKLMNEIESEVTGTIKEILVQNSEPVEYDQPLFVIEKA